MIQMEIFAALFKPQNIWVLIPLAAIILYYGRHMVNRYFEHQERIARIEAGMDPDGSED